MRILVYVTPLGKFKYKAVHLPGKDILSRWHEGKGMQEKFHELTRNQGYT